MPLDCAGAEEQLGRDLGVREAVLGQPRDLRLLGGEYIARFSGPFAGLLARGLQLATGALGERLHVHCSEHFVSCAELLASRSTTSDSAKPLAVQQVRARQFRALRRPA